MTNRTDMRSPDAIVLTHALEKLRACDGLTSSRLENSRNIECGPLLGLAAVRRYAAVHDIELSQAALDVIRECVRDNLQGSQRIVADAVLGLAVFSEAYTIHGIQARVISSLCCHVPLGQSVSAGSSRTSGISRVVLVWWSLKKGNPSTSCDHTRARSSPTSVTAVAA
jgi:hypothetical protein